MYNSFIFCNMCLSFLKSFFAKRRQRAAECDLFCQRYIDKFKKTSNNFSPLERNKEALSKWLKANDSLHKDSSLLSFDSYRWSRFYKELLLQKAKFEALWLQISDRLAIIDQNAFCSTFKTRIDAAFIALNFIFSDKKNFIRQNLVDRWAKDNKPLIQELSRLTDSQISHCDFYQKFKASKNDFLSEAGSLEWRIKAHNDGVLESRIDDVKKAFGLDNQQAECIVKEAHSQLILVGAGTGKTTTIVGKVKYLLKEGLCGPEEILALSYNTATAKEMNARLPQRSDGSESAYTFHKFGKDIIAKVEGRQPKLNKDAEQIIKNALDEKRKDPAYLRLLFEYLTYNKAKKEACLDFNNQEDYEKYLSENPICTLNQEQVKSYGEMNIANFLLQNGIAYQYEAPYSVDTRTAEYGAYKPDFYLPDYKIYIEYFGIDRKGNVPSYFANRHGMSARVAYRNSMQWKRDLHKANGTVLVECYAYEKFEEKLLENLKARLLEHGVKFYPKTSDELWGIICQKQNDYFSLYDQIVNLFVTLLHLTKSNDYTIAHIRELNADSPDKEGNEDILTLFEPLFNGYNEALRKCDEIDFDDMINRAARYVREGHYKSAYKYVIVDEYQDISKSRFNLLHSLRETNDFNLFCVGDDWQSIYRFTGSDINYILDFEKYWGESKIDRIETTYRFPKPIIDASSDFVMMNEAQRKKRIKPSADSPLTKTRYALAQVDSYSESKNNIAWRLDEKLKFIPHGSSVFFIGRYNSDKKLLEFQNIFRFEWNEKENRQKVICQNRPDLNMTFLTVHSSKGLQADYVFILNNKSGRKGFPSQIENPPIINLLLERGETYPYAEERRLYYVAMTRAKKKVFFVNPGEKNKSIFYKEICEKHSEKLENELKECPLCGGRLKWRTNRKDGSNFWGCENYHSDGTGCGYTRNKW